MPKTGRNGYHPDILSCVWLLLDPKMSVQLPGCTDDSVRRRWDNVADTGTESWYEGPGIPVVDLWVL